MEPGNPQKISILLKGRLWLNDIPARMLAKLDEVARHTTKMVKDDPRRLIHSLKVGSAVTLVSLLYYFEALYSSFGVSALLAVITVVVVFEFFVGATIAKGLNRGLGTLAAGALGLGVHHLANLTGKSIEPYLIGLFVFVQAVLSTFIRFFPKVKARYDYGMLIFIMTFSLVSISGFRTIEVLKLAQTRVLTILIGGTICVIVCILICPVWAGEDLHKFVAQNIEELGCFLEDAAQVNNTKPSSVSPNILLIDSKSKEEILANFATWEPGHGQFMYHHPWAQYLKIGSLTRQCAYRVETLNGSLTYNLQAPEEIKWKLQEAFSHCGEALKEISRHVQSMTKPSSSNPHIANLKMVSENLKSLLEMDSWGKYNDILQVVPIAAVLIDTVGSVEHIAEAVNELGSMAKFKVEDKTGAEGGAVNENNKNSERNVEIPSVCIRINGGD